MALRLPTALNNAVEALSALPGIGQRSAERLVMSLLKNPANVHQKIGSALIHLKDDIGECERCFFYTEKGRTLCDVCAGGGRNTKKICVVETPVDMMALEKTGQYDGLYHVLHGVVSPLEKIGPEDVRIPQLVTRIRENTEIDEIILATSGSTESEATALYIMGQLREFFTGDMSQLSRGIPSGGDLDYLDMRTLSHALADRRKL